MHKAKKIAAGVYEYRGVVITKEDYGWHSDEYGFATSLSEAKKDVDFYEDRNTYVGFGYSNGWGFSPYEEKVMGER